jgi:ribosome biogenesis protein BMS1
VQEKRQEKKERQKAVFNASYDGGKTYYDEVKDAMQEQLDFNKSEFEGEDESLRVQFEGFRPGLYVRIEISHIPYEMVEFFNPRYPVIVGGLMPSESALGYVQIRFKKHRWYKKVLKTRDPIILSVGWRRFETVPLYAIEDHNGRNRLLKYTPEHMHCVALVYGTSCVCMCVSE